MPFVLYTWCLNPPAYPFTLQLPSQGTTGSDGYQHHLFSLSILSQRGLKPVPEVPLHYKTH